MSFFNLNSTQRVATLLVLLILTLVGCKPDPTPPEPLPCPNCPSITALVPDNGRAGDIIRIEGERFGDFTNERDKVSFNGKPADVINVDENFLDVKVPAEAGDGKVIVHIKSLKSNELEEAPIFTFNFVVVNEISPNRGKAGDVIDIKGKYFDPNPENNLVLFDKGTAFDPVAGIVTNANDSLLRVVIPEDGGSGPISVTVDGHIAGGPSFYYIGDVTVDSIAPDHGKAGDVVVIHGTNFRNTLSENKVWFFNNVEATEIVAGTDTTLTVKVPEGAKTGQVFVEVDTKIADGPIFTYDLHEVTALVPNHGRPGESIKIEGTNFSLIPGLNEVSFNGVFAEVTSSTQDHLIVKIPDGVSDGLVSVTVGGYPVQGPLFTVDLPVISSVSALIGKKDDPITIQGNYFGIDPNAVVVKFNGKEASLDGTVTETQIDVLVPVKAGTGPITVEVNGVVVEGPEFVYEYTTVVSTFAGDGTFGNDNGQGSAARFRSPAGIVFGSDGNFYVADRANHLIRKITSTGLVSTLAGSVQGYEDGLGAAAKFKLPTDIAMDENGDIIVTDEQNNRLRKIDAQGNVITFSGNGQTYQYNSPGGIAVAPNGNIFVADTYNNRILKVTPTNGNFTVFAGAGGLTPGFANGTGTEAKFAAPTDVAVDSAGNVYVADRTNGRIRKITPDRVVTTIAGNALSGDVDGQGSAARFKAPTALTIGPDGNIYVADRQNQKIRMVTPSGLVTTVAGSGFFGFINGPGNQAEFKYPNDLAFDDNGDLFVVDNSNHAIRKVTFE